MGLELRSNKWASMKVTAPTAGYVAGQMVKVEDTIGVIVEDADAGAEAVLIYECEKIVVPKNAASSVAFSIGDKVYFDESAGAVTATSTGNTLCGRATEAAITTDDEVEIDLKGNIVA